MDTLIYLTKLNLVDTLNKIGIPTDDKKKVYDTFEKVVWIHFIETDIDSLSDSDKKTVENFLRNENIEGLGRFLKEQYPDIKERMIKNALLAKKKMIVDALDFRITYIKASARRKKTEDTSEPLIQLQEYAAKDQWEKFSNFLEKEL